MDAWHIGFVDASADRVCSGRSKAATRHRSPTGSAPRRPPGGHRLPHGRRARKGDSVYTVRKLLRRLGMAGRDLPSYIGCMADTITIRSDSETEHALDVLTHDGISRSAAIRQAVLEAALRKERAVAMRRAVLRMPLGEPDGIDIAAEIAHSREDER